MSVIQKVFGTHSEREIKRIESLVNKIEGMRPDMMEMSDEQLRDKTKEYKKRLTEGETLDDILPEAYATVREAARRVLKTEHYRVQLIGGIVLSYIWLMLFNSVLAHFSKTIVSTQWYAFWGLIIVVCWQQIGYMMIIYVAGIQNIPGDLIEAAKIDGANNLQLLKNVTLPMLMPTITVCTFLTLTNGFKLFDQNLALTGGNPGKMSQLLALNIYDTMYGTTGWQGVGQAKAVIFFILVALISLAQNKISTSKEVQG